MYILRYLGKRIVAIIVTISAVIALGYTMMFYAPGGFFNSAQIANALGPLAAQNPKAYHETLKMFQERYGLNLPLWHQILNYIWHSLTFNFGNSFQNPNTTILSLLKTAFPISAELAFGSVVIAILIGFPLGVLAALKRNTWIDYVLTTLSMIGQAIPPFVSAVILVLFFGVWFQGIVPVNGWGTFGNAILPTVALSLGNIGVVTRYMRGSLIEVMRQDHIRTAQAKGVSYWPLVFKHGIRNALTAMITVIGPTFAFTVVGTVWVENIFSIPGLGSALATAFTNFDFPLAITSIFILSTLVMLTNLLVDIGYSIIDPRVKLQ